MKLIISNELEHAFVLIHFELFFMPSVISYINLSWAVVGIIDKDVNNSLQSMKRYNELIEVTIERYVLGYLAFWHIAYIDKEKMNRCED